MSTLICFTDDHKQALPQTTLPGPQSAILIERIAQHGASTLAPHDIVRLALEQELDGWQALLTCHLATRHLARGRDARAVPMRDLSIAERCELGLSIAPFPEHVSRGGDPLGDVYHYFANVLAGVFASHEIRESRPVQGWTLHALFYSGPILMDLVRQRTFGSHLFFGTHKHVDRIGLSHGRTLVKIAR